MQVAIAFGFPSHWLINWREIIKPITIKHSNCNRVITFDSHLKTALCPELQAMRYTPLSSYPSTQLKHPLCQEKDPSMVVDQHLGWGANMAKFTVTPLKVWDFGHL